MQQYVGGAEAEKERRGSAHALPRRYSLADMRLDCEAAFTAARAYHLEIDEIQRHFAPWRRQTHTRNSQVSGRPEAAPMMSGIFDGTGIASAASFVANMQADWLPMLDDFFALEPGPLWPGSDDDRNRSRRQLQGVSRIVHGLSTPVRLAGNEMFADLFAGTGAMFFSMGPRSRRPIDCEAVPIKEIALARGPKGTEIDRWFWRRNYKARHIGEVWPDGKIGDGLARLMRERRDVDVEVTQYTYWDYRESVFRHVAWTAHDKELLADERLRVTPWVTPRMMVVPGEPFGRGLGHLGLANVRTINKAREYALRAAAIQLLGIWVHRQDGVFNPETAMIAPGAFWEVGAVGGPHATLSRLDTPYNFDMAQFVIGDERNEARRVTLDDEIPELADRVRSPTEIAARQRRYDRNRGGTSVRLAHEMIAPIARASIDVLERHGMIEQGLDIDNVLLAAVINSPAALAQSAAKVERVTSWLQIIIGLFGPQAAMLAGEVEALIPQLARWMGVEERYLRTQGGTEELKQMIAQYAAQMQMAEQAKGAQAEAQTMPDPDPVEQFVSSGAF